MVDTIKHQRPRVFSGIQPSGMLHIGNYLGAIRPAALRQDSVDGLFCIVDMHALTSSEKPEVRKRLTREIAAMYIACGIDPAKSTIFVQSTVPAHAECCWILNCISPLGWLERMTQFKAKSLTRHGINIGLLDYPVLQAADILLYDTDEVPVGEDQKQHIEFARDIAQRFNRLFGDTFKLPSAVIPGSGKRIRALNDPSKKMSKSDTSKPNHAIRLTDEPDVIRHSIRNAVTDIRNEIKFSDDPDKAGINNLLEIYEGITNTSRSQIENHFVGKGYDTLKTEVAEVVIESLQPIRQRFIELINAPEELNMVLKSGAMVASAIAESKMDEIKQKVGLL
ncbi:tryptophan--tRNA ligase [candidate division KSB1 bacterium]|nr:tryptophan--tRNA ligase [candidate division KSB1 bacterium]